MQRDRDGGGGGGGLENSANVYPRHQECKTHQPNTSTSMSILSPVTNTDRPHYVSHCASRDIQFRR